MLIKIGDAWVDPEEIVGVREDPIWKTKKWLKIRFRHDSAEMIIEATLDEAEAALIDAGFIENPYPEDDEEAPELSTEERVELEAFDVQGFAWLARDADGKVFAYKEKPALENGYFFSPGATQPVQAVGAFAFLQPCDSTAIPFLLCP
jgi:hypothetical protein